MRTSFWVSMLLGIYAEKSCCKLKCFTVYICITISTFIYPSKNPWIPNSPVTCLVRGFNTSVVPSVCASHFNLVNTIVMFTFTKLGRRVMRWSLLILDVKCEGDCQMLGCEGMLFFALPYSHLVLILPFWWLCKNEYSCCFTVCIHGSHLPVWCVEFRGQVFWRGNQENFGKSWCSKR